MKFDWSEIDGATVEQQATCLKAWQAELGAFLVQGRYAQEIDPSVRAGLLLVQRKRLVDEMQSVISVAETGSSVLQPHLSSLRIALGCQQLLEADEVGVIDRSSTFVVV